MAEVLASQFDFVEVKEGEERKRCSGCSKILPRVKRYETEMRCMSCKQKAEVKVVTVPQPRPYHVKQYPNKRFLAVKAKGSRS